MLNVDDLLERANRIYATRKSDVDARIRSDQVLALLAVLVAAINAELLNSIVVHVDSE